MPPAGGIGEGNAQCEMALSQPGSRLCQFLPRGAQPVKQSAKGARREYVIQRVFADYGGEDSV